MGEKIFDKDFFNKLNNINLRVNLKLSQGAQGGRKSQAKGQSVEFSDFREYTFGDDFRRIDWNAYGRFEKLFIKVFMEEKEAVFNIFLDSSKSMDYGEFNKGHMALKISAALSYIILNNLDKVYVNILSSGKIEGTKSASGKLAFQRLLKELSNISFSGETNLKSSILKRNIKGRGVSVIISDFLEKNAIKNLEESLRYLKYKNQQIILIQILSKEEEKPELEGAVGIVDSENGEIINLDVTSKALKEYEKALKSLKKSIEALAIKYGARYEIVKSEDPIEKICFSLFKGKGW